VRSRPPWPLTCPRPPPGTRPTSGCRHLVADPHATSGRFTELRDPGAAGRHQTAERKTIDHPQAETLTLDCHVLTVKGSDLHITIYTAEPGTKDAERLAPLIVLGTQTPRPVAAATRQAAEDQLPATTRGCRHTPGRRTSAPPAGRSTQGLLMTDSAE
jgi:hypothetical protein